MILLAQQKCPQLGVQSSQEILQMYTARGEVDGEILGQSLSAAQKGGAGIVEGIVGLVIILMPAGTAQHALAAHLLGSLIEHDGGILWRRRGCAAKKAVVQLTKGSG